MATNGTHNGSTGEQLVGRVLSVNDRGLRIEGRDGWLNFSKWAGELSPPQRGARVTVTLDGQGFVRAIVPAEQVQSCTDQAAVGAPKDTLIIRQTCLKAAAQFCASRPDLKSADLLALAERMEAWVTR